MTKRGLGIWIKGKCVETEGACRQSILQWLGHMERMNEGRISKEYSERKWIKSERRVDLIGGKLRKLMSMSFQESKRGSRGRSK